MPIPNPWSVGEAMVIGHISILRHIKPNHDGGQSNPVWVPAQMHTKAPLYVVLLGNKKIM